MNTISTIKNLAAFGTILGGLGLAVLGLGTGLAHADTGLPPSMRDWVK